MTDNGPESQVKPARAVPPSTASAAPAIFEDRTGGAVPPPVAPMSRGLLGSFSLSGDPRNKKKKKKAKRPMPLPPPPRPRSPSPRPKAGRASTVQTWQEDLEDVKALRLFAAEKTPAGHLQTARQLLKDLEASAF